MNEKVKNVNSVTSFIPPYELLKHLEFLDYDVIAYDTLPTKMINQFIEYRKERKKSCSASIQERINNYYDEGSDQVKRELQRIAPLYIPSYFQNYISFDSDNMSYVYAENIPSCLEVFVGNFKRKVEERLLRKFELRLKCQLQIERLKNREIKEFPESLFKYIRFDKEKIMYLENMPLDLLPLYEEYKAIFEKELNFNKIFETEGWFNLPPESLFGYLTYKDCEVLARDAMPVELLSTFEEYKKEFDNTKTKYIEFCKQYTKVLPF